MAEASVKFFLQRFNSLLHTEYEIFSRVEPEIELLKSKLNEIGELCGDICSAKGDVSGCCWVKELRDLIQDFEDLIDEFILETKNEQNNQDKRSELTKCFVSEFHEKEPRLGEALHRMTELKASTYMKSNQSEVKISPATEDEKRKNEETSLDAKEGQTSSQYASSFLAYYTTIPYYLQYCLMYCCVFPKNHTIHKGKLVRLLVAEGLVQESEGQIMEDTAEENICKLIDHGILLAKYDNRSQGTVLMVAPPYHELILRKMEEENFITTFTSLDSTIPQTARRMSICSDMTTAVPHLLNIRLRSLYLLGNEDLNRGYGNWLIYKGAKFLKVLVLEYIKIKSLPDEVGDLILLTYLGLKNTDIAELPARLGNLRALQTLDIRGCGHILALPVEILNLVRMRHVKIRRRNVGGVKLPHGIERFSNILTLTGIHAGDGIAQELSNLIHLKELGVMDVPEGEVDELFTSVMEMQSLLSLSIEAKNTFNQGTLFLSDSFLPPALLRKLRLEGILERIPNWLGSMESLTKVRLGFSHLSEDPALVLQHLPNLESLTLWHAYDAKHIGKEFCKVGGFPKLEVLTIASHVLEEWTELEEGTLPSLKYLNLHNCLQLRMLPEGLQFVTTLKDLVIMPLLDEHVERIRPLQKNILSMI